MCGFSAVLGRRGHGDFARVMRLVVMPAMTPSPPPAGSNNNRRTRDIACSVIGVGIGAAGAVSTRRVPHRIAMGIHALRVAGVM